MKSTIAVSIYSSLALAAGCATTGAGLPDHGATPSAAARVELESSPRDLAQRGFPARISEAELRAADRLAHRIHAEHGGSISTQVKLCVDPSGAVSEIAMLATSGMSAFDQVVIDEVSGWKFERYAAPAGTRVCENLTVSYQAR